MNRKLRKPLVAIVALVAIAPAHAQMRHRGGMPSDGRDWDRGGMQQQAEPPRDYQPRQDSVPQGRLSPEERRQLRRDIHDAGRELYRPEHPRRPPQ